MATIKMPATPKSAYNPKRLANTLLLTQARELEKAVADAGRTVRRKKPKTEAQVAAYIRHLNRALHQQVLLPRMARRPLDVPLDGASPTGSRTRAKRRSPTRTRTASARKKKVSATRTRKRSRRS
jgi:hypothetical protein